MIIKILYICILLSENLNISSLVRFDNYRFPSYASTSTMLFEKDYFYLTLFGIFAAYLY